MMAILKMALHKLAQIVKGMEWSGMKTKLAIFGVMALTFVVLFIKSCDGPEDVIDTPIPTNDVLRVAVKDRRITVQTKTDTVTRYVADKARASVTVRHDGEVDFDVQEAGLSFQPIIGPLITQKLDVGIGAQVFYWNRFEGYIGLCGPNWAVFGGLGYRLDQIKLPNTSIAMVTTSRNYYGGAIFVRF